MPNDRKKSNNNCMALVKRYRSFVPLQSSKRHVRHFGMWHLKAAINFHLGTTSKLVVHEWKDNLSIISQSVPITLLAYYSTSSHEEILRNDKADLLAGERWSLKTILWSCPTSMVKADLMKWILTEHTNYAVRRNFSSVFPVGIRQSICEACQTVWRWLFKIQITYEG